MSRVKQKGFTLIETLIYIGIIGAVVASFVVFSMSITNSRNKTYVVQEVQANGRTALSIMTQKIRAASSVTTGSCTFDSDPGELYLVIDGTTNIINLDADDGVLQLTAGAADPVAITTDEVQVTNLVFTDLTDGDRDNIRIEMTAAYNNLGTDVEYTYSENFQTAVSLRQ